MSDWNHDEPRDVDWVSGAAMIIRRELIDDIGVLDEQFFMYCEDVDLAYRAWENNWQVMYFPDAVVMHMRGRSSDKAANRMIAEHHKSMYRFFRKHYLPKSSIFTRMLVPTGLVLRAGMLISYNLYLRGVRSLLQTVNRKQQTKSGSPSEEA
jgi:GT2 family glycosyltransferase